MSGKVRLAKNRFTAVLLKIPSQEELDGCGKAFPQSRQTSTKVTGDRREFLLQGPPPHGTGCRELRELGHSWLNDETFRPLRGITRDAHLDPHPDRHRWIRFNSATDRPGQGR